MRRDAAAQGEREVVDGQVETLALVVVMEEVEEMEGLQTDADSRTAFALETLEVARATQTETLGERCSEVELAPVEVTFHEIDRGPS